MPVNIVIADDHSVLRSGLRSMLNAEPDLNVVGEAAGGEEALKVVGEVCPDVLIADISMPGPNGIELTRILAESAPATRVLILSMHEDEGLVREAMKAGAWGYLPKRCVEAELIPAIRAVARGSKYERVASRRPVSGSSAAVPDPSSPLADSERELLRLVALGHTNAQIASALQLPADELLRQKQQLYGKLGFTSRIDVMQWARNTGLL